MIQKFIEIPSQPAIREEVPFGSFAYDLLYSMAEQYGHAQLKRYLDIYTPQNVENIADSFLKIAIPPGVSIKLS